MRGGVFLFSVLILKTNRSLKSTHLFTNSKQTLTFMLSHNNKILSLFLRISTSSRRFKNCNSVRSVFSLRILPEWIHYQSYFYSFSTRTNTVFSYNALKPDFIMSAPGIANDFQYNLTSTELLKKTDDLIKDCTTLIDKVAGVPDTDVSCETILKALDEAETLMATKGFYLEFAQHVSPDSDLRNASTEAERKLREFCTEIDMRKDVFDKLLVLEKKGESLTPASERYLKKLILKGKRNGLHLDENTRKKAKELLSRLNNLSVDFMKNINDVTTTLEFTKEELNGLKDDFIESLKKIEGSEKYEVTLKYPHYFPIMEKCTVPETRKCLEFAYNIQCIDENGPILTKMRELRHEVAVLLGYPNHATYITEVLMSKNPQTVNKFLADLAEKMQPLWKEEKKYLLELKEKECAEFGVPFDGKINSYDSTYYCTKAKEIKYAVDKQKLREYFPFPVVKEGLFKIYQDLLGVKFELIEGYAAWHEDVELYSVCDTKSGNLLGYFFLDLYPRPSKYGHAALFELQNSVQPSDGPRKVAVGAMVANFTKPKNDTPALLDHDEVVTFFHEFGHVMHYLCTEVEYVHFNLTKIERDFVECPSQMLENWCWEKESVKKMSSHYLTKDEIPEDMLSSLVKSRVANIGSFTLRQILLATYDQRIHSSPEGDTRDLYYDLQRKIVGIEPQDGTHFACHFGHLAHEYDAQYYGYLWSEVYSMDMFQTRFGKGNVLNSDVGNEYRNKILKPGSSQDAYDLVCNFLGREPTQEAFLHSKGLNI